MSHTEQVNKEANAAGQDQSNVPAVASGVPVIVLQTLQDLARFARAPYLFDISSVALGILEAVQTFKGNNLEGFKKLGGDVRCGLVYAINTTCEGLVKNGKPLSKDLEGNLAQLSSSIKRAFVAKQLRRNRISRFLTYKFDSTAIQEYRNDLWKFLGVFRGIVSILLRVPRAQTHRIVQLESKNTTIHELVSRITEEQEADRTRGGTGREETNPGPQAQGVGGSSFQTSFPGFNSSASFSGSISVNNLDGDQHHSSNEQSSTINNSYSDTMNVSGMKKKVRGSREGTFDGPDDYHVAQQPKAPNHYSPGNGQNLNSSGIGLD
ncbi:hypothetical protein V5O48_012880 [Marasmius crinis-equi]|uniref:Uncharacterized protein n=1 Tax=Marasmius crinis-equi TaxID=585013 RepID=A0ABR3F1N6_9AGAR